jgi:cytochrome c553
LLAGKRFMTFSHPHASAAALAALLALAAPTAQAQDFDPAAEAETCAACHGDDGVPVLPEAPIIWGQQFYYIYVQLRDYAAGRRANETMEAIASDYDKEQMQALATYFAEKEWPNLPTESADDVAAQAQRAMSAGECSQCHGGFMGDSRIPRVAGQSQTYLDQTLLDFKNRVRMNAPDKAFLMESYPEDDLHALAKYLAAL